MTSLPPHGISGLAGPSEGTRSGTCCAAEKQEGSAASNGSSTGSTGSSGPIARRASVSGDEGDAPAAPRATPPRHRAEELTAGGRLALIEHRGQLYSLRITRAGKLILTK